MLYKADGYTYYKVPVMNGTRLKNEAVPDTCERVGMKAVCTGRSLCTNNPERCLETPLSGDCSQPLRTLTDVLCDGNPRRCVLGPTKGLFSAMRGFYGDCECGAIKSGGCSNGCDMVSGSPDVYYAYCVMK